MLPMSVQESLPDFTFENAHTADSWKPIIISGTCADQISEELLKDFGIILLDSLDSQILELVKISNPTISDSKSLSAIYYQTKNQYSTESHYNLIYYPWRKCLIKLLKEEDFLKTRLARNAHKITSQEQVKLFEKKVGIIGLSVGNSVLMPLVLEGVSRHFKIADFDTIDLSNLNRINSSLLNLGLKKTISSARACFELDPYLTIEMFPEGITPSNIERFLLEHSPLDLVIDECDSGDIKLLTRIVCRKHMIPVIMETSDRGILDVERFDRDSGLSLLHGMLREETYSPHLSAEEKKQILLSTIDFSRVSERGIASFGEIGKTITTWPQLATDVISGGAHAAMAARLLLLGENLESGRVYVDVESIIRGALQESTQINSRS